MNTGQVYNVGGSWGSSNSSVASVDGYGNVTGNSAGSVTLTASASLTPEGQVCAYNPSCSNMGNEGFQSSGGANVTTQCFAQLKYRPVVVAGITVANHSFW